MPVELPAPRRRAIDAASALYLGMQHASRELPPWSRLTTGGPAALGLPPPARAVAAGLADLIDRPSAVLASSSLHALWDVLTTLMRSPSSVVLDGAVYPIGAAAARMTAGVGGAPRVHHYDVAALRRACAAIAANGRQPIVVMDGSCPACGRLAPIHAALDAVGAHGHVVIDDTQALGILGRAPTRDAPWGHGGGGSARFHGIDRLDGRLVVVASLAKAFGVPIAVIAGDPTLIDGIAADGPSQFVASPPSAPILSAARLVLQQNEHVGERRRRRLLRLVWHWRRLMDRHRLGHPESLLPAQHVLVIDRSAADVAHRLLRAGVRAVPVHVRCQPPTRAIAVLLTTEHSTTDLSIVAEAIARAVRSSPRRPRDAAIERAGASPPRCQREVQRSW